MERFFLLTGRIVLIVLIWACSLPTSANDAPEMRRLSQDDFPQFADDLSVESLRQAVAHSLNYFKKIPSERAFRFDDTDFSASWLIETLTAFNRILQQAETPTELNRLVQEQFEIYQAAGRQGSNEMLTTGYYEPVLEGSLEKKAPFLYPLYSVPPDLVNLTGAESPSGNTGGRIQNGKLVPYWSRSEIEKFDLLAGQELVYLADPVEAFILHVQGSGRVRLRDGSVRRLQYAAKNGRPYRSIGKLLIDEGRMEKEQVDLPAIVQYLKDHPGERERILHHNESYVFFRWGDTGEEGPLGSLGQPLVAGRSIALDKNCFPAGALCFLQSQKPVLNENGDIDGWTQMSRFVLNQDSGSAIKGPGRLDLFWGSDQYARAAAGRMKHPGRLYFLVKKKYQGGEENTGRLSSRH